MEERLNTSDFAGHCNEATAWRILKEVSQQLMERKQFIVNPFIIEIDDNGHFILASAPIQHNGFDAPEATPDSPATEAGAVWSLGATLFYIVIGRIVMNGKGGHYQKETSKLPYMRSEWPEMSELVKQCLQYEPILRPSMQDIHNIALKHDQRCQDEIRRGPKFKNTPPAHQMPDAEQNDLTFWPEAMQKKDF